MEILLRYYDNIRIARSNCLEQYDKVGKIFPSWKLKYCTYTPSITSQSSLNHISHEHNSPSIYGFSVYGEHKSRILWTIRQASIKCYNFFKSQPFSLERDHHRRCLVMLCWWFVSWFLCILATLSYPTNCNPKEIIFFPWQICLL